MQIRSPQNRNTEMLLNQLPIILEKEFLRVFIDILMNKKLINNSIKDRESIYILPSEIFLLPGEEYANKENLQNGYYYIENESHPLLMCVKNGKKTWLSITENEKVCQIIQSIKSKLSNHNHANSLKMYSIQAEFGYLMAVIHANPGHEDIPFSNKYLSFSECEKIKIYASDGTINRQACDEHSVIIDEKRINIAKSYKLDQTIRLTDRENLILEAAISNTQFHLFQTIKLGDIYDQVVGMSEDDKRLISERFSFLINHVIPNKILRQLNHIGLKGAPFYEPTEEFKLDIYKAQFELDMISNLQDQIQRDADKFFHQHKMDNTKASEINLCEFTMKSLYAKYDAYLNKLSTEQKHSKHDELLNLILLSVNKLQNPTNSIPHLPKPEAIRLIMRRGEGLVKMLNPIFINFMEILNTNDAQKLTNKIKEVDQKWEFTFEQLLDPRNHRPKRQALPDPINGFCFSPLLQKQVSPDELEVKSLDHTVMTSSTLLPIDGKMRLFGASHSHAIGLLFDLRMCDLVGEHFVFNTDTYTVNDWWHNPHATRYHNEFKGLTVNELIKEQKLHEIVDDIRDYNEILAGVNAAGITAILFQPAVDVYQSGEKDMDYYEERLNLIYRKLYIANLIGRHVPIIIFDAHNGPYQYTLEDQLNDLIDIIKLYPNHAMLKALLSDFHTLCEHIPEETESRKKPDIKSNDIAMLEKKKNIKLDVFRLQNDINHLINKIFILMNQQLLMASQNQNNDLLNNIDKSFIENKVLLNGLINEKMTKINNLLLEFEKTASDSELKSLNKFTKDQYKFCFEKNQQDSTAFHDMILGITSKKICDVKINKNTLPNLKNLINKPEYANNKDEIINLIKWQMDIIKGHIVDEIQKNYPINEKPCTSSSITFFSFSIASSNNQLDDDLNRQNALISKAMDEFEANIKFNPAIDNLEQLIIAQVKREAIQLLREERAEMLRPTVCVSQYGTKVTHPRYNERNVIKCSFLIEQLSSLDIHLPLHVFINKNHKNLKIDYESDLILKLIKLATESIFIPKNVSNHCVGFGIGK